MRTLTIYCEPGSTASEFTRGVLALPRRWGHVASEALTDTTLVVTVSDPQSADGIVSALTELGVRVDG